MEKDGSGDSTGKNAELDALLSAADRGMLEAIRDNLDLDTGFAHILGDVAGITPTGRPTRPAEAEPGGHAHSNGHALDPVPACEVAAQHTRSRRRRPQRATENRSITTGR